MKRVAENERAGGWKCIFSSLIDHCRMTGGTGEIITAISDVNVVLQSCLNLRIYLYQYYNHH